jgi:S-adenosylmethionine-diacylglycerol 3-amino-3-carboxypropyl transferase
MKNLKNVDFSFIRYANVWEDADNLLQALDVPPNSRIFSIASGGDNALALLLKNPRQLVVADVSQVQLFVTELKIKAIEHLSHTDTLAFLGFREADNRWQQFIALKPHLSAECAAYFSENPQIIENGLIHAGKFERYFAKFRQYILLLTQSKKDIRQLTAKKTEAEQTDFYKKHWNNWRWKLLFRLFFSRFVMGRLGRDPKFFEQVDQHVGRAIYEKAGRHLSSAHCQTNEFLHYILTGHFGEHLPVYMRPENFEIIKSRLSVIELVCDSAERVCSNQPFDAYNLSNVFEYMATEYFDEAVRKMALCIPEGATLAYWNLLVPRRFSQVIPQQFAYQTELSQHLTQHDKGFFYQAFVVEKKAPQPPKGEFKRSPNTAALNDLH